MHESTPVWDNVGRESMKQGPEGGRSIDEYESLLKFRKEDLENKFVLDLGAGPNGRFSKDLKESGVNATVVSMSPEYSSEEQRKLFEPGLLDKIKTIIKRENGREHLEVAGVGEELPFKDESFDEVLALYSVSAWSLHNYRLWIPEICRVLKPNGEARVGPFSAPKPTSVGLEAISAWEESKKWREDFITGLGYQYEYIPGALARQEMLIIRKPPQE